MRAHPGFAAVQECRAACWIVAKCLAIAAAAEEVVRGRDTSPLGPRRLDLLLMDLYPLIEPYAGGLLDVGDGNHIAWNIAGAPDGKPAVVLHGGPGQGCSPNMRRGFDPSRYRVVLFDQRGCGRSIPHASLPQTDMSVNTTHHLLQDMEALRRHLGFDKWLVSGGSWGATLAVAYAEAFPHRVSEVVLNSVTTSRPVESTWLYQEVAKFFPEAWQRFRSVAPEASHVSAIIGRYAELMADAQLSTRLETARQWCAWEDAVLSLEPTRAGASLSDLPPGEMIAFVKICTHYLRHQMWLQDNQLLEGASQLAHIRAVLIHGRRDLGCPVDTAWLLGRAWPGSKLVIVDDAGHTSSDAKRAALRNALDGFANG